MHEEDQPAGMDCCTPNKWQEKLKKIKELDLVSDDNLLNTL